MQSVKILTLGLLKFQLTGW